MNDNSLGTIQEAKTTVNESELDRIMQVHIDSGMFTKEQLAEMRKAEANRLKQAKDTEKQREQVVKKDETKEDSNITNPQPDILNKFTYGAFGDDDSGGKDVTTTDPKELKELAVYDFKANSKTYSAQNTAGTFFDLIGQEESEKGIEEVEETDTTNPYYYGFKGNLQALGMGDNAVTDFVADHISSMYRSLAVVGVKQADGTVAGWDMISSGTNASDEEIEAIVSSTEDMPEQTDAVKQYSSRYEQLKEEEGGTMAFMVAVAENPTYIRDVALSSLGNMATSLVTSPDVARRALVAGTTTGLTNMAVAKYAKNPIGKGLAFMSGFMGGMSGSMDAGQSYSEFLQEQLAADGKDFTPENIRALLNDDSTVDFKDPNGVTALNMTGTRSEIIKKRAIRRGIAIGVVDGISTLLAGKTFGKSKGPLTTKASRSVKATGKAVAGGIASEIGGQTAGSQEYDAGEILTEGIAEKGVATTGVTVMPQLLKKKGKYTIGKQEFNEKAFVEEINKMDDATLAAADVKVENDATLDGMVKERQGDAYLDSQVNGKVTDVKDRKKIVELEKKLNKAKKEAEAEKNRDDGDTSAAEEVAKIKADIAGIVSKYSNVDGRSADVRARNKAGKEIKKSRVKIYLKDTEQFAEVSSEQLDYDPYEAFDSNKDYVSAYVSRSMSGMDLSGMTQEQIEAEANRLASEANNSDGVNVVRDADGRGKIMINREIAAEYGAMNVGSHEVLHAVMEGALEKMTSSDRKVVIKQFKDQVRTNLGQKVLDLIDTRLRTAYGKKDSKGNLIPGETTIDLEETSEWFTALSDIIEDKKNNITYKDNKSFFDKIKDNVASLFNKNTPYEKLSIETGEQAFNFMKEYSKSVKAGKLSESMVEFANNNKPTGGSSFSRGKLVDDINDMQQGATTKAEFQQKSIFNNVFSALERGGAINNYIRSLEMSPEKTIETIDAVTDRLINFNPEAKRKDGTVIGPRGLGEFIMANVGFGKLVAAEKLFKKSEKVKRETSLDADEARQVEDKSATKKTEPKGQKARVLTKISEVIYNVANSIDLNNKIQAIINANPKNLEQQLRDLITKEITKAVKAQMGKISKIKGEVEISGEYKAFLAFNYENIVQSLDVATIKNNYNQLFELTEIGKEDRKTRKADKPSLKKDSNYRKGIFEIKTNKAKFTKFFTEGGYTTLLARQKGLATIISESLVEDVINNEIIENSKDANAVTRAKLRDFASSLDRQKKELQGNYKDIINFSKQELAEANFLMDELQAGEEVFGLKGVLMPKYSNISKKVASFVYKDIFNAGLSFNKNDQKYIQKAYQKLFDSGKRGEAYETAIIDQIIALEKVFGTQAIEAVLRKPTEVDGKPDAIVRIYDQVFNIEAKMSSAQYSSVTFAVDKKTGKFVIKKDYSFNSEILSLGEDVQKRVKVVRQRLAKEGYSWDDISIMPTHLYNMLKKESVTIDGVVYNSYINALSAEMEIDLDVVSEIYNKKKYATNVIQMMGRGLFYMGGFNDVGNILGLPPLKGKAKLTLRVGSNSQYKTVNKVKSKTGNTRLSFRAIPTIPPSTLNELKSDKSIGTAVGTTDLMNSKEVLAIKQKQEQKDNSSFSKSIESSRTVNEPKGITVLDFDDTLATSRSLVISTSPEGVIRKLTAEEFAQEGADLLDQGWTHDFSEFSKVVGGKVASLFKKAMKLQGKFGPENMFVLTARPADSASAIFDFLKANGLNIPIENITGLGNSTAEAKALWIANKVSDGYNDFYFADDALQNVQAVKNMLDQFDVKSKVQQAKVNFSNSMSNEFNNILDDVTGVESQKVFSEAQAKIRGQKSKYKSIIPPSAQDFAGLLYNFLGKGKKGEKQMAFFKKALIDPFARAINELNAARQASANDYENLLKQFPKVKKLLNKKIEGTDYTHDQAVRIYLWNKAGFDIPGLSKRDLKTVLDFVENNSDIKSFAETVGLISKKEDGYSAPGDYWLAENIKSDLLSDGSIGDARAEFLAEWQQNADIIFSPENLNKIEAIYGSNFREALQDILYRMKTGRNRPAGGGRLMNIYTNWVNNSVGAIMFFNMRSALLQTISATNYINWSDNNPLKAAAAFANQKQYWKDFSYLFNSDYLKQRRAGNQRGVNEAELSAAVAGAENKAKAAITWLLKKGFLPTQIADSFAIASGGATFYRNRIKALVKEGMTQEQAEKQAFLDFQETTEVAQQSARPDMISQQQASPLGKLILAFQNTPMQYARIMNKAARDLANGRGDSKTHMSKIIYYGFVQSIIFGALQSALFASLDDEDEEKFNKKKERILNGMADSVLSGIGYGGKAVSTMKNTLITFLDQRKRGYNADHTYTILQLLGFSPPIGSKLRKIYSSIQTDKFNKDVFLRRGFTLDNPIWSAIGNVVEGVTNVPLGRLSQKMLNIDNALDANNKWWQRVALVLGWNTWDLGIRDADIEGIKADVKKEGKKKKKKESQKDQININKQKQKQEKKEGKKVTCAAISKSGNRCKTKVEPGSSFCTIHEEVKQNKSGKKVQCKKIKSNKKRCGMQTSSASGYCYYHD